MTLAVFYRHPARHEFDAAADWYEARRTGLGAEFVAEIERAVMLAAETPTRFPVMHSDVRCVRVRRFPYSVFFKPEVGRIVVLAVFHARRDPIIWQQRT
jgi:toxin ParE1/3/4